MMDQPAFGQRLRALRSERGLSQAALADGAMSTGYLSRLESGARPPTERVVQHLARRLGVPASAFEGARVSSLAQAIALAASSTTAVPAENLAESLQADCERDPALRWLALWYRAQIASGQGRHREEYDLLLEVAELGAELKPAELRTRPLVRLSRCATALGDSAAAHRHALEAHVLVDGLGVADRAAVLQALLRAETETGRLPEARAHAEDLCVLTEPVGGALHAESLRASATVLSRQGDHAGAQRLAQRALERTSPRSDPELWVRLQLGAASLALRVKPPLTDRAGELLDELAPVLDVIGTPTQSQQMLALMAHLAYFQGRFDDARRCCDELDGQTLRLSFRDRTRHQALRSQLLIRSGRADEGVAALQRLARKAADELDVELSAEVWQRLAETLACVHAGDDGAEGVRPGGSPAPAPGGTAEPGGAG